MKGGHALRKFPARIPPPNVTVMKIKKKDLRCMCCWITPPKSRPCKCCGLGPF
ncbi:hypothetical protein PRIPAC_89187 [Pristionchus pacificus]|uniref:Uncharacterized protein n=1 Tax=Pristionchus pacificus TaxID=54126 RepID=A0A2A6CYT8_PRIPA|nr:hypothetical protein PRIPAC_89187 [Pristionchus pacificus]|eukprot:PDM83183.1 hypothetical protein PRIPAC_37576 [Pristionchus pacificus]